ncbi:hypothetical protein ACEWY4_025207 [Coilia grayii]|uniref:DUF4629 domain-containing protein n=1 Tax=Coilia grayii TaxID=363190 RepID=A0ABD1IWX8_9TELE
MNSPFFYLLGVQQIFANQTGGTYFHGVAPTTGSGVINQPGFWPEYHGYQPHQHPGLLGTTAQPQFLPLPEIQVLHPITPQGYHGVTFQGGAVPFDPQLQGPLLFVDAEGQQHGISVASHPQLQAPLVAMDGTGPQYGVSVPYAPQMQAPIMYVDANGQQLVPSGPFNPQLQGPIMLMDGPALPHGAPLAFDLHAPFVPVASTGLQRGTTRPLNPQAAPFVPTGLQHVSAVPSGPVPFTGNLQRPTIEEPPSSANPMRPAPVGNPPAQQCQQEPKASSSSMLGCVPSGGTTITSRPQATKTTVADKPKKSWDEDLRAMIGCPMPSTSGSKESLAVKTKSRNDSKKRRLEGGTQDGVAKPADKRACTEDQEPKTAPIELGKANTSLPKKAKEGAPERAGESKDKKRKRQHDADENKRKEKRCKKAASPTEKSTTSGNDENNKPDAAKKVGSSKVPKVKSKPENKDKAISKKPNSKRPKEVPIQQSIQPRSRLGEQILHSVTVFHKLGDKVEKGRPPVSRPAKDEAAHTSQSDCPDSTSGTKQQPMIPFTGQRYRIPKKPQKVPGNAPVRCNAEQAGRPAPSQQKPTHRPPDRRFQEAGPQRPRPQQGHQQQGRPQQRRPPRSPQPQPRPKHYTNVNDMPHYYKDHSRGSVGNYGDGEVVVYLKPEYKGMFPLPLVNLPPLPPGAPRRFHCREYSNTITAERRAEREAMKRKAKLQREEEAKITGTGMDCSVLAERKHLPYAWPQPGQSSWWDTGLGDVEQIKECKHGARDNENITISLRPVTSDNMYMFSQEDLFYSKED